MSKRKLSGDIVKTLKKQKPVTDTKLWMPFDKLAVKKNSKTDYVTGTGVKNYLMKDPILDWFDMYYVNNGLTNKKNKTDSHKDIVERDNYIVNEKSKLNILFDSGNIFENKVMNYLKDKFGDDMITITTEGRIGSTKENFNKTVDAINKGIPIIAQAVLFNDDNKTKGIADLLVRSDYINLLVERPVKEIKEKEPIHYKVIDIKWTTMTLCANGYTLRNDGRFPAYKGQLAIYNYIVGKIQGYISNTAYVLAKAWKIDSKKVQNTFGKQQGYNCFDLLGEIDYTDFDYKYIDKTADAIKWVRDVRHEGHKWNILKPVRKEMYPNASNKNDAPWTKVKKDLCEKLDEITQIWYVSDQNRQIAHDNGVYKWSDPRCTSELMQIGGDKKPHTINEILDINRDPHGTIEPDIIENNLMNWQIGSPVDFYVDFETINELFCQTDMDITNSRTETDIVFMIGVGYVQNNKWNYKVFTMNELVIEEEGRIFDEFTKFIKEKSLELDPTNIYLPRLFHWSYAEVTNFDHVNKRHNDKWVKFMRQDVTVWTDMYYVFTNEPIVVKGAFNFKLKEIGKAMHKLGYIKTEWDSSGPSDGFAAMLEAVKYYKSKKYNESVMKSIIDYNEIDCKVIYDIVDYLRKHHCKPIEADYDLTITVTSKK
jgi:predicted RecB family nuclease